MTSGRLQLLHGTAAAWTSADSVLLAGEIGVEEDTGQFKIGDGSTAWTSLPYAGGGGSGAPTTVDYLVGTASGGLSAEIVVGTTPGGELGGTWASPTVDATHSGSAHHDPVTVGTGLDVTGQLVELDLSEVAAGGDLSGFMDAPSVVDDSHAHSASTLTGVATLGATEPGVVSTTGSGTAGSGSTASKVDHSHDLGFDDATADPAAVSTAASDGTATSAARKDHVHAHEAAHLAHDTLWDSAGDLVVGTGADTAAKLAISVPAANVRNVLGVDNGETTWSVKAILDGTNPAALGTVAPGTALTAAHRDHVHPTTGLITSGAKITALSSLTPTTDDIVPVVDDPGGTPVTKKATLASIITLAGSASNPAALGTAAAGTSGNKMSRDDHVHPTTGLVTTTIEVVGGGTDIAINDTNYVTLATTTFDIAAGNLFIAELDFLILNNSGATKTYTTVFDVNGFLVENVDGTTHGANATNRAPHTVRASCEVRATNLAYSWITNEWTTPGGANVSSNPSLSQLTRTWNSTTGNATGSSATVRIRIKSSNATATQTATVLGWRIRKI